MKRFILFLASVLAARPGLGESEEVSIPQAQVDWVRSEGGFFHSHLNIQPFDESDPESPMGVFAVKPLPKGETLMIIPQSCLLTAETSEETCDTARNLMKQRRLKNESKFAPYVNYLFHRNDKGQLPAAWSKDGQELLTTIIGPYMPPYYVTHISFKEECGGTGDPFEEEAFHIVRKRSWDDKMLPLLDMCNHRNGRWKNVDSNSAHIGEDIKVFALRDIDVGEQLYLSYNECADCTFALTYVLQDILKDFGFVEQYPRRWRFPTAMSGVLVFELDEKPDSNTGDLQLTWLSGEPNHDQLYAIQQELERVQEISDYVTVKALLLDSDRERGVSVEFYNALKTALEYAARETGLQAAAEEEECAVSDSGNEPGTCASPVPPRDYDELEEPPEYMDYNKEMCDFGVVDESHSYESQDYMESQYTTIEFYYNEEKKDTCLRLNDHLQACASFRPHYHEVFVHYPARYVDEVKRVAFLGGGDNMIVHEILKYPSLELVVGMELDHQVVRSSFKNLGTQPHWDDERVQWWFGDASKSLLMLPEEYYGTFDLVLLDLQTEVVEKLKVTEELNIMEAAMLLLKPDGVIARNEDWEFGTSKPFTDYAVDLYYVDVPLICCQGITLGSNSVDFLKRIPKDHEIDSLYLKPPNESQRRFDFWYNYRKSSSFVDKIPKVEGWGDQVAGSAGILMVLEAEDTTVPLKSPASVQAGISTALKKAGLTETSVKLSDSKEGEGYQIVFILKEGYVVARAWPEHNYCAFDIQLWCSFEKQNAAEQELISATGSKTVSSYRVNTSGMFGLPKGNVSGQKIVESDKPKSEDAVPKAPSKQNANLDTILSEGLSLLQNTDSVTVVVCGEESQPCGSMEALTKDDASKKKVVPLWTCPDVSNTSAENAARIMYDCEQDTLQGLGGIVKSGGKIGGIVIDPKAPLAMGQILIELLYKDLIRTSLLEEDHVILSTTIDASDSSWRRAFLDRFRTEFVEHAPAHRAEILFHNLELGVFRSGDDSFYLHLMDMIGRIETKTGLVSEVRSVKNGINEYVEDFVPSKTFSHDDYDSTAPQKQWFSQKVLGAQAIIHISSKSPLSANQVEKALRDTIVSLNKLEDQAEMEVHTTTNVGDGSVLVATGSQGSILASWNGKNDISVNLFFTTGPQWQEAVNKKQEHFEEIFEEKMNDATLAFEDFPRGIGRIVNYVPASGSQDPPHWA